MSQCSVLSFDDLQYWLKTMDQLITDEMKDRIAAGEEVTIQTTNRRLVEISKHLQECEECRNRAAWILALNEQLLDEPGSTDELKKLRKKYKEE